MSTLTMKTHRESSSKETAIVWAMTCVLLLVCAGCGKGSEAEVSGNRLESLAPTELKKEALDEIVEFNFLGSEDAGIESLEQSAARLKEVIDALIKNDASGNSDRLKASRDSLASALEGGATSAGLSKACTEIQKDLKSIFK